MRRRLSCNAYSLNVKYSSFLNPYTCLLRTFICTGSNDRFGFKKPNRRFRFVFIFLQNHSNFRSVLAKIWVEKQVNSHYFLPFTPYVLSVLKNKTCILHHLAFLDWSPPRIFSIPITRFLPLKTHFLTTVSHLSVMCFIARKGYVYTICGGYLCFSPRILHHLTLHLAPKCLAFSTKTHCI